MFIEISTIDDIKVNVNINKIKTYYTIHGKTYISTDEYYPIEIKETIEQLKLLLKGG